MKNKFLFMLMLLFAGIGAYAQTTILPDVPEKGKDYTLTLTDGSIIPTDVAGNVDYVNGFFKVTVNQNSFKFNGAQHGFQFGASNVIEIGVAGSVDLSIGGCQYSNGTITLTDGNGTQIGESKDAKTANCYDRDQSAITFNYTGEATTLKISLTGTTYIPVIIIKAVVKEETNGLADVWDFGAAQLDAALYNNKLTEEIINGWYDASVTVGSEGNTLPSSWTAGILSWNGGSNDRLRTANTSLTRYDTKNAVTIAGESLTGYVYVNGAAQTNRYLSLNLNEDDEVLLYCSSQNGNGLINFVYANEPARQTDVAAAPAAGALLTFAAKYMGTYKIYDTEDKPSYYRVLRKPAVYAKVHGAVQTETGVTLPDGYGVQFTNEAGKIWDATISGGGYGVSLPMGHTYTVSLANANGYVIDNVSTLEVGQADVMQDVHVTKVALFTVTGSVSGLDAVIGKLKLVYTPAVEKVFVPEPQIDVVAKTYTVELEPDVEYTITAEGVNDYVLTNNKITVTAAQVMDLVFETKPVYAVTLNPEALTEEQKAKMSVVFTNLNEEGYAYTFASLADVKLRDGVYSVVASGLEEYPLQQALTSNLKVDGQAVTKSLKFDAVDTWTFDDRDIANGDLYYKGLALTGSVRNEKAKGHLVVTSGATVAVPVETGNKVIITYYYAANFKINGGEEIKTTTSAGSTSKTETVEYLTTAADNGVVTLAFGDAYKTVDGTGSVQPSYVTEIRIAKVIPYTASVTVGEGKDYATINEALDAVRGMDRPNNERVKLLIEPGNYEEMLVVDVPNVSLVNASATPSIALKDKGVNIDENAVRITSYYGHGYNYYSMASDQKWNAETLAVNKENGYLSYENKGSGTTNGSYWNATVVVTAEGFEADNIIFENSFNQYISQKESEDVVVEWETGGKGVRPTTAGSTAVQNKSFVERAAAIALKGSDKAILFNCRVVGRQDSFYGGDNLRAVVYKGVMMGATDYIFGEMTAVFYQTRLAMNTSEDKNDVCYITAGKQNSGRGYLMYECTVTSAQPEVETASAYRSKPGYFGRPWQPNTTETVFYNTTVETSDNPDYNGLSLIVEAGWNNTLSGTSPYCSEYGTIEKSGADNSAKRAGWATVLIEPKLADGTDITTLNFTKGTDGWDPIPALIEKEPTSMDDNILNNGDNWNVFVEGNEVFVNGISAETCISVYGMDGTLVKSIRVNEDAGLKLGNGLWIVRLSSADNCRSVKVLLQ